MKLKKPGDGTGARPVGVRRCLHRAAMGTALLFGVTWAGAQEAGPTATASAGAVSVATMTPGTGIAPKLWGSLHPGKHRVGFRALRVVDPDRPTRDARSRRAVPRPLEIFEWYPAQPAAGPPMRFGDYAELAFKVAPGSVDRVSLRRRMALRLRNPTGRPDLRQLAETDDAVMERLFQEPLVARRAAAPARGRHPLVLLGMPDYSPGPQLVLAELLASHGFVVAGVRERGLRPPPPWEIEDDKRAFRNTENDVRNLEFLAAFERRQPHVDPDRFGLLSWSRGGGPAAAFQMRRPGAWVLVSLDSIVNDQSGLEGIRTSPLFDLEAIDVPYVFMIGERPRVDLGLYRTTRFSRAYLLKFEQLSHANFFYRGGMLQELAGLPATASVWVRTGPVARLGYEWVARYALHALKAFVVQDANSRRFIDNDPRANGVPAGFLSAEVRPASASLRPPTDEEWVELFQGSGPATIKERCAVPVAACEASRLLDLARRLTRDGRTTAALATLEAAHGLHPEAMAVAAALAREAELAGRHDLAKRLARRVLEHKPDHQGARSLLGWLDSSN